MKIIIKAKNADLEPGIKDIIEEKIGSLEKFSRTLYSENYRSSSGKSKSALEAFVEIKGSRHKKGPFFRIECQLKLPKKTLRSEIASDDIRTAIDRVRDDLQRELKKAKEAFIAKIKRKSRASKKEYKLSSSARFYRKGRIREEGI